MTDAIRGARGIVKIEALNAQEWERRKSIPYYTMSGWGGEDEKGKYMISASELESGDIVETRHYESGDTLTHWGARHTKPWWTRSYEALKALKLRQAQSKKLWR